VIARRELRAQRLQDGDARTYAPGCGLELAAGVV